MTTQGVFHAHWGRWRFQTFATAVKMTQDKIKEIRAANPQPVRGFPGPPLPAESSIDGQGN